MFFTSDLANFTMQQDLRELSPQHIHLKAREMPLSIAYC